MPHRLSLVAALLVALGGAAPRARAEEASIALPDDIKFVIQVDVPSLQSSALGGPLFSKAKDALLDKMADKGPGKGEKLTLEKIVEILGFDPFVEIQRVAVAAADYNKPEQSLVGCIQLRKTSGNLEGLLLAFPGYSAEDHNGEQIYSAKPDEERTVFGAIHVGADGNRTVLVSARRESIVRMLDSLSGKSASKSKKSFQTGNADAVAGAGRPLAVVDIFELPKEVMDDVKGPQANVAKIIRGISARFSETGGQAILEASVTTDSEKQAEQLEQMVKGLSAMIDLAVSADNEDEDLQMVQKWLKNLKAAHNGATADLSVSVPVEDVQTLIDENLLDD